MLRITQNNVAQGLPLIPNVTLRGISLSVTPAIVSTIMSPKGQLSAPAPVPTSPKQPTDLSALARLIAESAPSLQFVAIDLSAAKDASDAERAWFRVHEVGVGSARKVQKIGEQEGRAIVATMRGFNRYD